MRRLSPLHEIITSLKGTAYQITSPTTWDYNCIGWAAEDMEHWWWPFGAVRGSWWPDGVPRQATQEAFVSAFDLLGYEPIGDPHFENGYTRVALYRNSRGEVTHMARQLPSGVWTSKCGRREDIEHARLEDVGSAYGAVSLILRRPGRPRSLEEVRALTEAIGLRQS